MNPKSSILASKRFLDVDIKDETSANVLDTLIMQYELKKFSVHTPIHERLHN